MPRLQTSTLHKRVLTATIAALTLGAVGCTQPTKLYLEADRATYDAIGPEYLNYVKRDGSLDPEAVNVREATVRTWRERIEAHEAAGNTRTGPARPDRSAGN